MAPVRIEASPFGRTAADVSVTRYDVRAGDGSGFCVLDHGGPEPLAPALRTAAVLRHPPTGRRLTLRTSAPGLQVYTGNDLGDAHARHAGVALEAQGFPDAPHHPSFPSWWLGPDVPFRREIRYAFATDPA